MRRNKYNNQTTIINNIPFDSKLEAGRYQELTWLERSGKICDLELQPVFEVIVNGCHICKYIADFRYRDVEKAAIVVEDTKSPATRTPVYRLKKKLVEALYGFKIIELY